MKRILMFLLLAVMVTVPAMAAGQPERFDPAKFNQSMKQYVASHPQGTLVDAGAEINGHRVDKGIKIGHEKEFCQAFYSSSVLFARYPSKDKKFCKAFNCQNVIVVRRPNSKYLNGKEGR